MATGFSVMDALNKNSKAGVDESPRARFRTKDISIFKMYRNKLNFYDLADIEELAGDILMYGLKQNLEVVFEPNEQGEYRIVAGERRRLALKHLVEQGYKDFEIGTRTRSRWKSSSQTHTGQSLSRTPSRRNSVSKRVLSV